MGNCEHDIVTSEAACDPQPITTMYTDGSENQIPPEQIKITSVVTDPDEWSSVTHSTTRTSKSATMTEQQRGKLPPPDLLFWHFEEALRNAKSKSTLPKRKLQGFVDVRVNPTKGYHFKGVVLYPSNYVLKSKPGVAVIYPKEVHVPVNRIDESIIEWAKGVSESEIVLLLQDIWNKFEPDWDDFFSGYSSETFTPTEEESFNPIWYATDPLLVVDTCYVVSEALLQREVFLDRVEFSAPFETCMKPDTCTMEEFDYMVCFRRVSCHRIESVIRAEPFKRPETMKILNDNKRDVVRMPELETSDNLSTGSSLRSSSGKLGFYPPFKAYELHTEMYWITKDIVMHQQLQSPLEAIDPTVVRSGKHRKGTTDVTLTVDAISVKGKKTERFHGQRPHHAYWLSLFHKKGRAKPKQTKPKGDATPTLRSTVPIAPKIRAQTVTRPTNLNLEGGPSESSTAQIGNVAKASATVESHKPPATIESSSTTISDQSGGKPKEGKQNEINKRKKKGTKSTAVPEKTAPPKKPPSKKARVAQPVELLRSFEASVVGKRNTTLDKLQQLGGKKLASLLDQKTASDVAMEDVIAKVPQKQRPKFLETIMGPIQAYQQSLESTIVYMNKPRPLAPPSQSSANSGRAAAANSGRAAPQFKKIAGSWIKRNGTDWFPFKLEGKYWDGSRKQVDKMELLPTIPSAFHTGDLSDEHKKEVIVAFKQLRDEREKQIDKRMVKYLLESDDDDETEKVQLSVEASKAFRKNTRLRKEKVMTDFLKALEEDKIPSDPNDPPYLAFKEFLAPHLVQSYRKGPQENMDVGDVGDVDGGDDDDDDGDGDNNDNHFTTPAKLANGRSTLKSRMELFRNVPLEKAATVYDAAFFSLYFKYCLEKKEKQEANVDGGKKKKGLLKGTIWSTVALKLYSTFVKKFGLLWESFQDEDYIYPLLGNFGFQSFQVEETPEDDKKPAAKPHGDTKTEKPIYLANI
jgi:hypothetical protein